MGIPSEIAHTIQWARQIFLSQFSDGPTAIAKLFDGDFEANVKADQSSGQLQLLKQIGELLDHKPSNFDQCIELGRLAYEKRFVHTILQLLVDKPMDLTIGEPPVKFWKLPRRLPSVLQFDAADADCLQFVQSAAHLNAKLFGITVDAASASEEHIAQVAGSMTVPPFVPAGTADFEHDQSLTEEQRQKLRDEAVSSSDFDVAMNSITTHLQAGVGLDLVSDELEKDDDSNFLYTKLVAGRIIPAIATTTSVVSALVCVEVIKLLAGARLEQMKNAFLNLALPFVSLAEPYRAERSTVCSGQVSFTMWDTWEVDLGPAITLTQLADHFRQNYDGLEITAVLHKGGTVYMAAMPMHASRLKKKVCDLPSIKIKPAKTAYVDLNVVFKDPTLGALDSDESVVPVATPTVRVKFQ